MRISQREARRNLKRLRAFEQADQLMRRVWSQEYFGATDIGRTTWENPLSSIPVAIRTARKLHHAVVAVGDDSGMIRFMALPYPKVPFD